MKTKMYGAVTNMLNDAKCFMSKDDFKSLLLDLKDLIDHMLSK